LIFILFFVFTVGLFGARFVIVKGTANIIDGKTTLARHLAIENAKILALENARGTTLSYKTLSENSAIVFSKIKSQINGKILKYSILKEWVDDNNYWVEIGALVSEKDETPQFSIIVESKNEVLKTLALEILKEEGFITLEEPTEFFPKLTLDSTTTERSQHDFYGKRFFHVDILLSVQLENIDGSVYSFGESESSSDLSYSLAWQKSIENALKDVVKDIKQTLDNPRKLYLKIKNTSEESLQSVLKIFDELSPSIRFEHFAKGKDFFFVLEITEDPLIFLSRIVKSFERKIDLTWKNGIYEIEIPGGA